MPRSIQPSRRDILKSSAGLALGLAASPLPTRAAESGNGLIADIARQVVFNGRGDDRTWFHPRACMIPGGKTPHVFMTLQSITGSDMFGHVHWTMSKDLGKTWSKPERIRGLGRKPAPKGLAVGVCDVVPTYHPKTNTVLAIGHNVYYNKKGHLARPQLSRWPVYLVRKPDGTFTEPRKLEWNDPRGSMIYSCGCSQRVMLAGGDVLIPLTFGSARSAPRSVTSTRCSFDGKALRIKKVGTELKGDTRRGLLEPSLVRYRGKTYMTIRAEDNRGYVAVSDDGLTWSPRKPWCWDDGTPLTMSTTQQHWLAHSDALYLVYTRKAEHNVNVFRWRAPLFVARVDVPSMRLVRSSERVALPLIGDGVNDAKHVARMGNFHTVSVGPHESWVTVGECLPQDGWKGDTLIGRIRWAKPNGLVPPFTVG